MLTDVDRPSLDPQYTVGSVARAIKLLNILSEAGTSGVMLTEAAKELGMSKSSVFSLLQTLLAYDLVSDHGTGAQRRYRLGLGLIRLGHRAAQQTTIADLARPVLESLSEATGLTSRMAVLDSGWAVALAQVDAPSAVKVNLGLGEREWLYRTALGKSLVLDLPDLEIEQLLNTGEMAARTQHTLTTPTAFLDDISAARIIGYTVDDEEDADGILCIAAPVRTPNDGVVAAISVTGIKAGPEYRDRDAVAAAVCSHADKLGLRFAAAL
jgi:IclR family acetate operon transcriptional repressor